MRNTDTRKKGDVQNMTTNYKSAIKQLMKIRTYLFESISQAADEIKEIDDILQDIAKVEELHENEKR